MRQLIIILLVIAIAFALMAVGVIMRKDHSFRSQHISENKRMKQDGIHCATSQDRDARRKNKHQLDVNEL